MSRHPHILTAVANRREVITAMGGALAIPLLGAVTTRAFAAPLGDLTLFGPPAGPSITLAHAAASGALSAIADKAGFKAWRDPDEMRAGITSGTMQAVVLPVQAAAILYNRGLGVRLLNVMTNGLLYIVSGDESIADISGLKGRSLAVPFRNDTPDLVLAKLLMHYGLAAGKDIDVQTVGSPIEAIQMLLAGRVDAVLAPEPAISAAIIRGKMAGKTISRIVDIQKVWGEVSGGAPILPQAGLALTERFTNANPDLVDPLQAALERVTDAVNANPAAAAVDASPALDLPAPIIAASIATSNLVAVRASAARASVEAMLSTLSDADPKLIGGKLPDDGFYL